MTKRIRIENADTSSLGVVVEVYDRDVAGGADRLVQTIALERPTDMTPGELYLTRDRYCVVRETQAK